MQVIFKECVVIGAGISGIAVIKQDQLSKAFNIKSKC